MSGGQWEPGRRPSIFDSRMKVDYSDPIALLQDVAATGKAYDDRLAREDYLATPEGFSAAASYPTFQRNLARHVDIRDRALERAEKDYATAEASIRAEMAERLARAGERRRQAVAYAFWRFEGNQQGDLYFAAGRTMERAA